MKRSFFEYIRKFQHNNTENNSFENLILQDNLSRSQLLIVKGNSFIKNRYPVLLLLKLLDYVDINTNIVKIYLLSEKT